MPFDPSQPREPKGSDIGGQWTATGGAGAARALEQLDVRTYPDLATKNPLQEWIDAPQRAAMAEHYEKGETEQYSQAVRAAYKQQVAASIQRHLMTSDLTNEDLRAAAKDFYDVTMGQGYQPQKPSEFAYANLPRGRALDAAKVSQGILDQWAASSADANPRSVALQLSAADLMGFAPHVPRSWEQSAIDNGTRLAERHARVLGSALGHVYDRTQQELKAAGIETVEVYRGLTVPKAEYTPTLDKAHVGPVRLQPLSSFSTNVSTAHDFAHDTLDPDRPTGQVGVVMATRIPRSRIFSTPRTGPGCLSEWECIILGNKPTEAVYAGTRQWIPSREGANWFPGLVAEARKAA
jgi:hypothetical protein